MTPQQISQDVARGLELRETIKAAQAELKAVEQRLEQAGLEGEQIPLQEPDREGRQFLARSPQSGLLVPVVFESDQIVASFRRDSETAANLRDFCETHRVSNFAAFYQPSDTLARVPKDGQAFRRLARETLGTLAPEFVSRCLQRDKNGIPKNRTIIAWDHARPLEG